MISQRERDMGGGGSQRVLHAGASVPVEFREMTPSWHMAVFLFAKPEDPQTPLVRGFSGGFIP